MKTNRYLVSLALAIILILSSSSLVFAQNSNVVYLNSVPSKNVSVGIPSIKQDSPFIVLPAKSKQNLQQSPFNYSVTVLPSTFSNVVEVPFKLTNGEYMIPIIDSQGKINNSGKIYSKESKNIGLYFVSTEKINNNIKITSNVKNNTLALSIETNQLLEPVTINVEVIFPTISTYFSKHEWITRGKIDSISFTPTPYLLSSANYEIAALKNQDAWEKIVELHNKDAKWTNMSGLQKQFNCHYNFAKNKNEWNLEPARKNVSYASTIMASCNPNF